MVTLFRKQNSCLPAQTPTTKSIQRSTSFIAALILAIASLIAPQLTNNFYQQTAATAHAETLTVTGDQYIDATDGHPSIQTIPADAPKTTLAADTTTWDQNNGWYIADSSIKLEDTRVTVPANTTVNLLLKNNITQTIPKGIELKDGATLNIFAQTENNNEMGKLLIKNVDEGKAGIGTGGAYDPEQGSDTSFTVNIHGGNIAANGGEYGAGIGSGQLMKEGTINTNIYGGTTTATGGNWGAGIGSGQNMTDGTINTNIYGGTTTATGRDWGAGIGSGLSMSRGTINTNIYGGNTKTNGGNGGAGIGSGQNMTDGTINTNIYGGTTTATGGNWGAGIGSGQTMTDGTINTNIYGGTTTATGGNWGAGIGSGPGMNAGTINTNIYSGTTTATGRDWGAGIGSGLSMSRGTINTNIYGGNTKTNGGEYGAGIGSGYSMKGGTINTKIYGGIINTTGQDGGAHLGSGAAKDPGNASVKVTVKHGPIIINNGILGETDNSNNTYTNGYGDTFTYEENPVIFTGDFAEYSPATKDFNLVQNGTITGEKNLQAGVKFLTGITDGTPQYGAETTFNYVIPIGKTLTIDENSTLTSTGKMNVAAGGALTVAKNATLENNGELTNAGTITNNWKVTGTGNYNGNGSVNPFKPTVSPSIDQNHKVTATAESPLTPVEFNFDRDAWGTTAARSYDATDTSTHTVKARVNQTNIPTWAAAFYAESEAATVSLAQQTPESGVGFNANYEQGTITAQSDYEIKEAPAQNADAGAITVEPDKTYQIRRTADAERGLNASAWVKIPAFTFQTTPSIGTQGLTFTNPTGGNRQDGKIAGQTGTNYEYRATNPATNAWIEFTPDTGTPTAAGLASGDYQVRIKGNTDSQKMPSAPVTISLRYINLQVTPNPISASYNSNTEQPIIVTNKGEDSITITAADLTLASKNKFSFSTESSVLLAPNTSAKIGSIAPKDAANLTTGNYSIQLQLTLNGKGINPNGETRTETLTYQVANAAQSAPVLPPVTVSEDNKLVITAPADSAGKTVLYCVQPVGNNIFSTTTEQCTNHWVFETAAEAVDRTPATSYAIWAKYAAVTNKFAESPASRQQLVTTPPDASDVERDNIDYVKEIIQNAEKLEFYTSSEDFNNHIVSGPSISSLISTTNTTTLFVRVKANPITGTLASTPVAITLPKRAEAPGLGHNDITYKGLDDGQITRLNNSVKYEYKKQGDNNTWTPITGTASINNLSQGDYRVRIAADQEGKQFASANTEITIDEGLVQNSKLEAQTPVEFTEASFNYTQPTAIDTQVKRATGFNAPVEITDASIPVEDKNFTFTKDATLNNGTISVATGASDPITVGSIQPNPGLTAGTYTTTVKVTYQATEGTDTTQKSVDIPVSFKVTEATQDAPALESSNVAASETSITIKNVANNTASSQPAWYCILEATTNTSTADAINTACTEHWTSNTSIPVTPATSYKVFAFYPAVEKQYTASTIAGPVLVTSMVNAATVKENYIDYANESIKNDASNNLKFSENENDFADKSDWTDAESLTNIIKKADAERVIFVKVKGTDGALASAATPVKLPARPATPALTPVAASFPDTADGQITGLDPALVYEYKKQTTQTQTEWVPVAQYSRAITGLAKGEYQVRVKATDSSFASAAQTVNITAQVDERNTSITGQNVEFGSIDYGTQPQKDIQVTTAADFNTPVTITAVTLAGDTGSSFTVEAINPLPTISTAGSSVKLGTITPKPGLTAKADNGKYTDTLVIEYQPVEGANKNTTLEARVSVSLIATQANQAAPAVTGTNIKVNNEKLFLTGITAGSAEQAAKYCVQPAGNANEAETSTYCDGKWRDTATTGNTTGDGFTVAAATSYKIIAFYPEAAGTYNASPATELWYTTTPDSDTVLANNIDYETETLKNTTGLEFAATGTFTRSDIITSNISNYAGTKIYVRVKAGDTTQPASAAIPIQILPRPETPDNLQGKNVSYTGLSDGQITGINSNFAYEYKQEGASSWTGPITSQESIENLAEGKYLVRIAPNQDLHTFASTPTTAINIRADKTQTSGLEADNITFAATAYGTTAGLSKEVQVKPVTGFNTPVNILDIQLAGVNPDSFAVTKISDATSIAAPEPGTGSSGDTGVVIANITPANDLVAGKYTATINVTFKATAGNDQTDHVLPIQVSISVTEAAQDAPVLTDKVTASASSINLGTVNPGKGGAAKYCAVKVTVDNAAGTNSTACGENWTSNTSIPAEPASSYHVYAFYPAVAGKYTDSDISEGVVTTPVTATTVLAENINYQAETLTVPAGSNLEFATSTNGFDNKESQLADDATLTSIINNGDRIVYARVKAANGLPASTATKVQLPARPTLDDLTAVAATSSNNQDGQITGLDRNTRYLFKPETQTNWFTTQNATSITGLTPGTYLVTIPATSNSFAAKQPAQLKVAAATTAIGQLEIAQVTDTSITITKLEADPATGAKAEYSKDNGATWQESNTFTGLDAATKYEITARYQNQPASGTTTATATTNAAAPTTEQITGGSSEGSGSGEGEGEGTGGEDTGVINHENGTLNTNQDDQLEFATSKNFDKDSILPDGSNLEDLAGQTIYVRTKQNPETGAAASTPVEVKIPEKAATPNLGVTGDGKINGLTEGQGYQISTGTDPETENWSTLDPATPLTPGVYQIRQTGSSKDNTLPSAPTTLIVTSPIPELKVEETTDSSIRITPVPADPATGAKAEYSIDGGNTWQESNTFTGLEPASKHEIAVRYQLPAGTTGITNTATVSAATAAATPDANSLIDFTNQLLNPASNTGEQDQAAVEYATSKDFTPNTIIAADQDLRDLAGQTIYARAKANPDQGIPASSPVEVKVPVVAATPTATVSENGIITGLDPNLTYEYQPKPDGEALPAAGWITIPAGTTELKLAAGTYLLRVKADQNSSMFASAVQEIVVPETAAPVTPPVVTPPAVDNQDKDTGDDTGSAVALTSMILALVFSLLAIPAFALATKMVVIPGVNDR